MRNGSSSESWLPPAEARTVTNERHPGSCQHSAGVCEVANQDAEIADLWCVGSPRSRPYP